MNEEICTCSSQAQLQLLDLVRVTIIIDPAESTTLPGVVASFADQSRFLQFLSFYSVLPILALCLSLIHHVL